MAESSRADGWVGFDLGGTKMLATVFGADFKSKGRKRRKTRGHEGAKAGLERIIQTIHEAMEDANVGSDHLAGIGVGCPGQIDLDRGIIINAPNLGWSKVSLKEVLEKEFRCPTVIANDVDAGVYGEYRFGAAKEARAVLGVFPGTGIGGGFVYEGRILRGKKSSFMEIGHIQVDPNGRLCGCGRRGCLETVGSRLAISAAAAMAAYRGDAPHLREAAGTDLSNIRSKVLADAIKAGDTAIEGIVGRAARYIGTAIGDVVNLLGPDVVVLGGGLVEAMENLIVKHVTEAARERVMPAFEDTFEVAAAQLGDDATVLGAAGWAEESGTERCRMSATT